MATKVSGLIWLIPGFGGSELWGYGQDGSRVKLWLDPGTILQGAALTSLVWGATPPGMTIQPGGLMTFLGYGYEGLTEALDGLQPQGYLPMPFPYDWRDTSMNTGVQLANAIMAQGNRYDHKIVCHSFGTQVTQVALAKLKGMGQDSLVSRIVSLGGIFSGSYGPVKAMREEEDTANLLALANGANLYNLVAGNGTQWQQTARVLSLTALMSWPSTYDMLMDPSGADDPGDIYRSQAWNPANWSAALVPPNAATMLSSQNNWWAAARTSAYALDPTKWLCFVARDPDVQTPFRLSPVPSPGAGPSGGLLQQAQFFANNPNFQATLNRRAQLPGLLYNGRGDNRSTFASQTRPGITTIWIAGAHADLQSHPFVLGNLGSLLGLQNSGLTPQPPSTWQLTGQILDMATGTVWPNR